MDNPKCIVRSHYFGLGVYARERIARGEEIASFDGIMLDRDSPLWSDGHENHCIQFSPNQWRDSHGIARYLNHSCEPNCGIRGLFTIVAMRNVAPGEELLWDYAMSEDDGWRMVCRCGSNQCRGVIGAFSLLPPERQQAYAGYVASWLVQKYGLSTQRERTVK